LEVLKLSERDWDEKWPSSGWMRVNTPETSGSGNIQGMPVAFVIGLTKKREVVDSYLGG
jgi:hypothetical protein